MGLFKRKKKTEVNVQEIIRTVLHQVALADPRRLFYYGAQQYNPSVLVTRKGLDIFDQMKRDDQVKAAMSFRKKAILSSGWEIVSPEGKGPDWEVRQFVADVLNNLSVAGIRQTTIKDSLKAVLSSLDYGYSISEKIYEVSDKNQVVLRSIKSCSPHYMELGTDKYGNLDYLAQYQENQEPKRLPIEKFVIHVNEMEFGNPYGTAELEAAYRPWLIKDNSYKWFAMFLERKGIPAVFAMYDPNMYQGQVLTDLQQMLGNMQASTVGTIPRIDKDKFELWEPKEGLAKESSDIFDRALKIFDQSIARALLLPSNIGMGGDVEAGGSYARSKVHFDSFMLTVWDGRDHIAETIQSQVIKQLVDLNFTVDEYPVFEFLPDSDDGLVALMAEWANLLQAGAVQQDPEDEKHIRAVMGFPEPSEDRKPDKEPAKKEPPDDDKMSFTHGSETVNFAKITANLDAVEADARYGLVAALTVTRDSLIRWYKQTKLTPDDVKDLRLKNMNEVQAILRELLRAAYGIGSSSGTAELQMEYNIFTPAGALKYLRDKMFIIAGFLKDSLLKDAKLILLNALEGGELPGETADKLKAMFDKYIGTDIKRRTAKGFKVGTPFHIETIIRTNATGAFNHGRLTEFLKNADLLLGVKYSAIHDTRTTEQCRMLDGKVFRIDDPALKRFMPPLHFNCRSILVPVPIGTKLRETDLVTPKMVGEVNELVPPDFGGARSG